MQSRNSFAVPGEVEERLAAIVESSEDAIISKTLDGTVTSWNRAAERMFGYRADEMIGSSIFTIIPKDRHHEEPIIIGKIRNGERIGHFDTVRRHKDGSLIDVSLTVSPLRNAAGEVVGASKIARDISDRKRAEELQSLLLGEMSHRVKNVLAVATGLVALSARTARSPQDMATAVQERLAAYARAHELTRPGLIEGGDATVQETTLRLLIETILAPYASPDGHRLSIDGDDPALSGSSVTSLALVLHELATNAAKYGALSVPDGQLRITCRMRDGTFDLEWKESSGPPIAAPPERQGFGSQFTGRTIRGQFGGTFTQDWEADGVRTRIAIPADRLSPAGG